MTDMARMFFQTIVVVVSNAILSPRETVYFETELMYIYCWKKSFHVQINWKIAADITAGLLSGIRIDIRIRKLEQPSIRAASSSSLGIPRKNWINI